MTVSFRDITPFSVGVTVIVSSSCEVSCEVIEQRQDNKAQKISKTGHAISDIS